MKILANRQYEKPLDKYIGTDIWLNVDIDVGPRKLNRWINIVSKEHDKFYNVRIYRLGCEIKSGMFYIDSIEFNDEILTYNELVETYNV